jgi:hypothetical protein
MTGEITCVVDLVKTARRGRGEKVYLVTFIYHARDMVSTG